MQSERTDISTAHIISLAPKKPGGTFQHGVESQDLQPCGSSSEQKRASAGSSPPSSADRVSIGQGDTIQESLPELNNDNVDKDYTGPILHRISEDGNALLPLPPKIEIDGPYFRVVNNPRSHTGPQLEIFPNEVLTHILSHLPASSLYAVSFVSHRFYDLVTSPHAWRVAFSRFFPGQDAINHRLVTGSHHLDPNQDSRDSLRAEQRFFMHLTPHASWRSEYILRTRLLRSLVRGRPSQTAHGHASSSWSNSAGKSANAVVTYNSQLFTTINHMHAIFGNGKKSPRFIHGTDESGSACVSDPNIGKIDNWGLSDSQSLPQFADLFPGDQPYGLGEGLFVGIPNVMDVSQPFGMLYGEGFPGGHAYFRSSDEMRGRFLVSSNWYSNPKLGIPKISGRSEAICAVWIAKSHNVPSMTGGVMGIMTGTSAGIITAYSLGVINLRENCFTKGELTVKWMLSPGVPITAISVDECYNGTRKAAGRVFAVALNALGEIYYLREPPHRTIVERGIKVDDDISAQIAWQSGRNAHWSLVESTRRVAREDPYREAEVDGSYSPRHSSTAMHLSEEQLVAETHEIEKFLALRPAHFRKACKGWDMRRRLEVDFAGDDGMGAGENIAVVECGIDPQIQTQIKRFTRMRSEQASFNEYPIPRTPPTATKDRNMAALFGGGLMRNALPSKIANFWPTRPLSPSSHHSSSTVLFEEWRVSDLSLQGRNVGVITASTIDMSNHALLTITEDPIAISTEEGTLSSRPPWPEEESSSSIDNIPGHCARFIAVGSSTGAIIIWNIRGPCSSNPAIVNELQPLREIQTDSPQVSCLALSALYLVHGGNDGLVQAWDPLASTALPLRTINSRFSSRARRRLVQAEASPQGVDINLFAAGAIIIDPDPTVLRGMVSLGTHLRYWSYSSTAADKYSSRKRRLRRSGERGSNSAPDRFTNTGRGALKDYIATEQEELKKEKQRKSREEARLRGRFGVGLGGLNEEEALRYAQMISQETFQKDKDRRTSDSEYMADNGETSFTPDQTASSSVTVTPDGSVTGHLSSPKYSTDDEFDHAIEEAIRLSLIDGLDEGGRSPRASGSGEYDMHITYKQKKSKRSASSSPSTRQASKSRNMAQIGMVGEVVADDLDFALQLSLAEEQSLQEQNAESNASLGLQNLGSSKGKRRAD